MSIPIDNKFRILKAVTVEADNINIPSGGSLSVDNVKELTTNGDLTITTTGTGNVKLGTTKWPKTSGTANQVLINDGLNNLLWSSDMVNLNGIQSLTNKTIAFENNTLSNVMSTNTEQTISGKKHSSNAHTVEISTGFFAVRASEPNAYLHSFAYDVPSASFGLYTSDDAFVSTGLVLGYKISNIKANGETYKFRISYLSGINTTSMDLESIRFLTVSNSKHTLSNVQELGMSNSTGRAGKILIDALQLVQTNNVYLPLNTNVHLKYLENMTGSDVQTQLNTKVGITNNETITGIKTFEQAVNNSDNIKIKNTLGTINGLSIENAASPSTIRLLKDGDDMSFVISNIQRARIIGDDFNLTNGGLYKVNGTNLRDITETLQNKTISFSQNNLTNVASTNTDQNITSKKTFTNPDPIELINSTGSRISYFGLTNNYSIKMTSAGFDLYDETDSSSLLTVSKSGGLNVLATGGLKVNGSNAFFKSNSSTSEPTVNDDNTQGYAINSQWFRTTTNTRYILDSALTGAAAWRNTNRRDITNNFHITSSVSYDPFAYCVASDYYYNTVNVVTYSDGDIKIEFFNISGVAVIAESGTITAGGPQLTSFSVSGPLKYAANTVLRFSVRLLSGTTATVFTCYTV